MNEISDILYEQYEKIKDYFNFPNINLSKFYNLLEKNSLAGCLNSNQLVSCLNEIFTLNQFEENKVYFNPSENENIENNENNENNSIYEIQKFDYFNNNNSGSRKWSYNDKKENLNLNNSFKNEMQKSFEIFNGNVKNNYNNNNIENVVVNISNMDINNINYNNNNIIKDVKDANYFKEIIINNTEKYSLFKKRESCKEMKSCFTIENKLNNNINPAFSQSLKEKLHRPNKLTSLPNPNTKMPNLLYNNNNYNNNNTDNDLYSCSFNFFSRVKSSLSQISSYFNIETKDKISSLLKFFKFFGNENYIFELNLIFTCLSILFESDLSERFNLLSLSLSIENNDNGNNSYEIEKGIFCHENLTEIFYNFLIFFVYFSNEINKIDEEKFIVEGNYLHKKINFNENKIDENQEINMDNDININKHKYDKRIIKNEIKKNIIENLLNNKEFLMEIAENFINEIYEFNCISKKEKIDINKIIEYFKYNY
jgi:hypothetical protein